MEILGYRTVMDTDGIPYQVADVLHPGAILPVSIRTTDIHPVDEAQAIERVIDSSLKMVRIPFDDHSVPVSERVAQAYGYSELDGCGNDPDLVTELRGGF
jgi:hypothetical protein